MSSTTSAFVIRVVAAAEPAILNRKPWREQAVRTSLAFVLILSGIALSACGNDGPAKSIDTNSPTSRNSGTITAAQAWNHVGQLETVQFHVAYAFTDSAGTEFLDQKVDYTHGFVVTIYAS